MADAQGGPGIPPRWTSSAKIGVGAALAPLSRVWFTLSHGILNEVYYPRVDQACIRDLGMIVTDGTALFAEEKRDCRHEIAALEDGVPAYALTSTHTGGRFRLRKRIIADPRRDAVLQHIRLESLSGDGLRLFVLLAPHLVNGGAHNTAWLGEYKGQEMLFAEGDGTCLALAASCPWAARSAGFAGVNDGWQDLSQHYELRWRFDRAADGNVALCGELAAPDCLLALAFGRTPTEAAFRARASLLDPFETLLEEYAQGWRTWQAGLRPLDRVRDGHNRYRIDTAVLRTHESPAFRGGMIASLSIPWGASKGDDDLGGYHLVWPRDQVQTAGGFLACGANAEARRVLDYLRATQEPDGHWPQNCWLDGTPYWGGTQMDETAFPILLVDLAWRHGCLPKEALAGFWPMVRAAAGFLVRTGPATGQDRWEENAGYSVSTLAVEVAALLAAAELAELHDEAATAAFLRDTADAWNAAIEGWTYVTGTAHARAAGVAGHYIRIAPQHPGRAETDPGAMVQIRNRADGEATCPAAELVSPDALALVRFGLRDPDDPRIRDTIAVLDRVLKVDLPSGPCWHRYNQDGYGEHADGSPFDGTGIGRAWPLLTGERAHVELAAGRAEAAAQLLETMEGFASRGGLLPEQVWDSPAMPERELSPGTPSGSAMPLVWAHAEHLKLLRSLADGAVFDMPPQTVQRYRRARTGARCRIWRPDWICESMPAGHALRVDLPAPATVHWSADGWATRQDTQTNDTGLGLHAAELPVRDLAPGATVVFTWRGADGAWVGQDYRVTVAARDGG